MDQVVYKHIGRSKVRYSFSCGTTIFLYKLRQLTDRLFCSLSKSALYAPQILRFELGLLVLFWFGVSSSCGLGVTELTLLVYT